ncbi:MAG: WYL domain-containing protein [Acidimicrobiales bacterium]
MTTTTARPPAWDILEQALRQRRPVRLTYHGRQRTVCPHALGWKNSRAMVLAYQIGGQTSTGALPADVPAQAGPSPRGAAPGRGRVS